MGTVELAVVGLAGSGLGTALGMPMVWPRAERPADVRLMGAWLIAVSAVVFLISARLIGLVPAGVAAEHGVNILGLTAYPFLYLYVRQQTRPSAGSDRAWWLWIPAAVYLGALLLRGSLGVDTRVPFAWLLPVLLLFTAACAALVLRRDANAARALVPAEWIVVFLVILNVAQVVRMLFGHVAPIPALVPLVITAEFVVMVALVVWRSIEGRAIEPPLALAPMPAPVAVPVDWPRYEKSGLDAETAADLLARIDVALSADRLFADPALTLARLAAAVGSTPHQVSEALNRHSKITFHELLNRRRVEDVKAQLRDPSADRYTIEGIGASAGFGSRSALYAAFRRLEGMTPAEYRARR